MSATLAQAKRLARTSHNSERKNWLLARSEGLALAQREMNALAASTDMTHGSLPSKSKVQSRK